MQVEIWSDVVCPWCAIGSARLAAALERFDARDEVHLRWRSFELDPGAPRQVEGDYAERLARKYGTSHAAARAMIDRVTAAGADEGIDFRFDRARPGNTFDAHRLLHLAADRGVQDAVKDRFFRAYHTEGEAIGEPDVLQRLAVEAGLDEVEVKDVLAGDAYASAVRADKRLASELDVTGVPFFVIAGRFGVPGAQPADTLLEVLERART